MANQTILVVGGTGNVGHKVMARLRARGVPVRAMVRPGSDASKIEGPGVTIVRGDMLDAASLEAAFAGVDVVISCAAGYTRRRKTDTSRTDQVGNRNLALAARRAGVGRFVLNSILRCDDAKGVGHFEDKAAAEGELRRLEVPFVAIRPGAYLDQARDFAADSVLKNSYMGIGDLGTTRWTWVCTHDVADSLVKAAFADPGILGRTIDVGWSTGPLTNGELADAIQTVTNRTLKRRIIPWGVVKAATAVLGRFSGTVRDIGGMFLYFRSGRYVADTRLHEEFLGPVPTREASIRRWAEEKHLILPGSGSV